MKLVLVSNILENPGFPGFLRAVGALHPGAAVLSCGDFLNVFPEPGEDFAGSIFHEIFGERVVSEMRRLVETGFAAADASWLVEPLREMFLPEGASARRALGIADARYASLFARIDEAIDGARLHFIDGNMDYPDLTSARAAASRTLSPLGDRVVTLGGVRIAGLGGIPSTVHPFSGVVEISPNEMSEPEYARRLGHLAGADVLCTHVSPDESPALGRFLDEGGARVLVCRAPFDFAASRGFRGPSSVHRRGDALVVTVRPFEWPAGSAPILDLGRGPAAPRVEIFSYAAAA
jgi:Icc-related predicted phosphoesterase